MSWYSQQAKYSAVPFQVAEEYIGYVFYIVSDASFLSDTYTAKSANCHQSYDKALLRALIAAAKRKKPHYAIYGVTAAGGTEIEPFSGKEFDYIVWGPVVLTRITQDELV